MQANKIIVHLVKQGYDNEQIATELQAKGFKNKHGRNMTAHQVSFRIVDLRKRGSLPKLKRKRRRMPRTPIETLLNVDALNAQPTPATEETPIEQTGNSKLLVAVFKSELSNAKKVAIAEMVLS